MNGINLVALSGNLTRNAEVRMTAAGTPVTSFGIAVNESVRNSETGEWDNYANFVDVVMFGKLGETLSPSLVKGVSVCLSGKLRYSSWERDGQKRSKIEVIADRISLAPRSQAPETVVIADDLPF